MPWDSIDLWNHAQFGALTAIEAKIKSWEGLTLCTHKSMRATLMRLDLAVFRGESQCAQLVELVEYHREIYQRLIASNQSIVVMVTAKVMNTLVIKPQTAEVQAAALLGLIYAIERFDVGKGTTFGAFAYIVAKQRVWDELKRPGNIFDRRYQGSCVDVEGLIAETTFETTIASSEVWTILKTLPAEEREVLAMRLGFEDGHEATLKEAAQRLGVSHETVRRREKRGLWRIREWLKVS